MASANRSTFHPSRRPPQRPNQFPHLVQAQCVKRQENEIKDQRGVYASEKSIDDEQRIAGHAYNSERNHCLHRAGDDARDDSRVSEPDRPFAMTQELHSHPPQSKTVNRAIPTCLAFARWIKFLTILL